MTDNNVGLVVQHTLICLWHTSTMQNSLTVTSEIHVNTCIGCIFKRKKTNKTK